jgi:predicted DsbA family dithiol-disulfide isomerase
MAIALVLESQDRNRAATWRERVFTAIFEEGRSCDASEEVDRWARDLGQAFSVTQIEEGATELERRTRAAAEAMVTGVPTFLLGEWPLGGIQDDDTMVNLINRFATRRHERMAAKP